MRPSFGANSRPSRLRWPATPAIGRQHRSILEVEIWPASEHPALEREPGLRAAPDDAIAAAAPGGRLADLVAMRVALQEGRVGLAGSASVGRYDVVIAADLTDEEPNAPERERDVVVGVLTPGGTAAPRDVLGKLELLAGVSSQTATVASRGSRAHGGDGARRGQPVPQRTRCHGRRLRRRDREQLDQVVDALEVALAGRTVPMYVGVGHRNYERALDSSLVRMCATPADAAELFRIEVLDIPRRRADLVARASADLLLAVGDSGRSEQVTTRLATHLGQLEIGLQRARAAHGQPMQS